MNGIALTASCELNKINNIVSYNLDEMVYPISYNLDEVVVTVSCKWDEVIVTVNVVLSLHDFVIYHYNMKLV